MSTIARYCLSNVAFDVACKPETIRPINVGRVSSEGSRPNEVTNQPHPAYSALTSSWGTLSLQQRNFYFFILYSLTTRNLAHTTIGCGKQGFPSAQPYLSHTPVS